ncbi:MAG: hypothetical protein Q7S73_02335 [bacterium]|nr:hypothetical protein [bacterium]
MKCEYIKQNNSRCGANAMTDSKFCFSHDPDMEVEKSIAVLKGGYATKRDGELLPPVKLQSINDITSLIEDTINRIRTEPMTHHQANSIGYLSGVLLKALETGELKEKLELINGLILERKSQKKK